eukprot:gene8007-728_t
MGLSRFIWGVIITLLQVPAGIDAGIVLDPRETIISEPSIAFLIHDLDGFGGSPHAIHAVQSLIKVGGWKGTIVFVTTCPNKRHLSALFDNNKVWIKQLPHMSQSSKRLLNSTHTRFAESFRFMPPEVTTVIMLDSFVFVADSLNEFIWWVYEHIQNKLRTFSGPASFIAAFAHEDNLGWKPDVIILHRILSTSCLSFYHSSQKISPSSLRRSISLKIKPGLDYSSPDVVKLNPAGCAPVQLPNYFLLQLNRLQVLLKTRATFVRLQTTHIGHGNITTGDPREGKMVPFRISPLEYNGYISRTLGLKSGLAFASESTQIACTQDLIASDIVWSQSHSRPAQIQVADTNKANYRDQIPHIVVGGFAKCATTTLFRWLTSHPYILKPWIKEPNFDFHSYETPAGKTYLQQLWYEQQRQQQHRDISLPSVKVKKLTIDASTHLLWNMTHVTNLYKRNPSAKLIAIVCDPIHRLISHWNFRRFVWEWEFLEGKSLDNVVIHQLKEMPDWVMKAEYNSIPDETKILFELDNNDSAGVWQLVREGLYELALQRVETQFPRESLLVVVRDDLEQSPLSVLRSIETFLGIPHFEGFDEVVAHMPRQNVNRHAQETISDNVRYQLQSFYTTQNLALEKRLGRTLPWERLD